MTLLKNSAETHTQELRLGLIGTNFVSDWLCEAIDLTEGICAYAVCSRTMERAREFASGHGIPHAYDNLDAFFASETDIVYIAVPNKFHYGYARQAIKCGKHVLLEKPACLSAAEYLDLMNLAREHHVVILEAMMPGHDPALETIRNAMQRIGKVRSVTMDYCQYSSRYDKFRNGVVLNAFDPSLGNAAIMDIGCYAIHMCISLFGSPESITSNSIKLSNGFEGLGHILLKYPEMIADIIYSKITNSTNPSTIVGEDGTIQISNLRLLESAVLIPRTGVGPRDPSGKKVDWKAMFSADLKESENDLLPDGNLLLFSDRKTNNMTFELADLMTCISELTVSPDTETAGTSPTADHFNHITLETLKVIDTVTESLRVTGDGSH